MRCVLLVVVLASVAQAGEKEDAWIAHRASAQDADKLRGMLREGRAVRWTLDALVRIGARVHADEITPHLEKHPDASIVLLSRLGWSALPALRRALKLGLPDGLWMAVCNLLAERRAPRFAAYLLSGLRLRLELNVHSSRNSAIGIGGGSGEATGLVGAAAPEGYPPPYVLLFTDELKTGDVVVGSGRTVIAFQRVKARAKARVVRTSKGEFRCRFLNQMYTGPYYRQWLRPVVSKTIYWEGEEDYVTRATRARDELLNDFEIVVKGLERQGFLTAKEGKRARPRLSIYSKWIGFSRRKLPTIPVK